MPKLICEDCGEVLAEDLDDADAESLADEHDIDDQRDEQPEEGEEGSGDGDGDEGEDEKKPDRKDVEDLQGGVGDDLEDEYESKVDEMEDDETPEEAGNDAQEYFDAADEAGVDEPDFIMGAGGQPPQSRWRECKRDAERISRVFQDKLRQKRREKIHREQRSGRFDSNKMVQADRGSSRVFKRREEGGELKYETYFVLDRSSSMRNDGQKEAENAVATLMKALEDAGVKTELIEFMGSTTNIVKTKSQSVDDEAGNILRRQSSGGTPIDSVMDLLEERVTGTEGEPFVVVVTDAEITGTTKTNYLKAIERMNWPVLGVTIGDDANIDRNESQRVYHYSVNAESGESLKQKLTDLARNVML